MSLPAAATTAAALDGTAGVQLYTTVGVHPHDAKTLASFRDSESAPTTSEDDEIGHHNPVCVIDEAQLSALRALAAKPHCVSLGECGLDYDRMFSARTLQLAAFEAQVALAAELQRPLFVHVRDREASKGPPLGAYADLLAILGRHHPTLSPERVCIHCFTGGAAELRVRADIIGHARINM